MVTPRPKLASTHCAKGPPANGHELEGQPQIDADDQISRKHDRPENRDRLHVASGREEIANAAERVTLTSWLLMPLIVCVYLRSSAVGFRSPLFGPRADQPSGDLMADHQKRYYKPVPRT